LALQRLDPAPLRHECTRCGGSCQGAHVRLVDDADRAHVIAAAAALGVADPVDNDRLRTVNGACVFQAEDGGCRVHSHLGMSFKPKVCQQYPLVAVRVGPDVRVGIDPGCYASLATWTTGPEIGVQGIIATTIPTTPREEAFEDAFLDASEPDDANLRTMLAFLVGAPPSEPAPRDVLSAWVERMQDADLRSLLDLPDTSAALRVALAPALEAATAWDRAAPPAWPDLDPALERHVVQAIRQIVWLRLGRTLPMLPATVMLLVLGAVAVGWADPRPERFGVAFAGWIRAVRARAWWSALVPDEATLGRLLGR
jgi:hypothetical protein